MKKKSVIKSLKLLITAIVAVILVSGNFAFVALAGPSHNINYEGFDGRCEFIGTPPATAEEGSTVNFSFKPNPGYILEDITTLPDVEVTYAGESDGSINCGFTMPSEPITVTVQFSSQISYDLHGLGDIFTFTEQPEKGIVNDSVIVSFALDKGYKVKDIKVINKTTSDPIAYGEGNEIGFTMPNDPVLVDIEVERLKYSITYGFTQTVVEQLPQEAYPNDKVKFKVVAKDGYRVESVTAKTDGGDSVEVSDDGGGYYSFTMPDQNVHVTITSALAKGKTRKVKWDISQHARVTAGDIEDLGDIMGIGDIDIGNIDLDNIDIRDISELPVGITMGFGVTVDEGYKLKSVTVTGADVYPSGIYYMFKMPDQDVTITVTAEEIQTPDPEEPTSDPTTPDPEEPTPIPPTGDNANWFYIILLLGGSIAVLFTMMTSVRRHK